MITKIEIDGFKTFNNFKIELSPLVIIAGANGSGKSNLFDAILLLSRLAETDLKSAFQEQRGEARELFTQYPDGNYANQMRFVVEVLVDKKVKDSWGGEQKLKYTRLKYTLEISRDKDKRGLNKLYINKEELLPVKKADDDWCKRYVDTKLRTRTKGDAF
jgi:predicted ATPase